MDEIDNSLLLRLDKLFDDQSTRFEQRAEKHRNVAQYRLGRILGSGGFGFVYLAEDTQLNRSVALKMPRLEALFDKEKRKRFSSEAQLAARLDHPGIVKVYEAELDGLMPFIASEYCPGPNLAEWLSAQVQLPPWQDAVELVANIAEAVDYAHQHNVFHRDLKPANIMVTPKRSDDQVGAKPHWEWLLTQCEARLTDFGLAKLIDSAMTETRTSQVMGTPLYMSPEQIERGGDVKSTASIDIYSLGVILFELLTGNMPINGSSYIEAMDNIRYQAPERLRNLRADLPRDLETICAKCLEKNPEARYSSADELAADLRRCASGLPIKGRRSGAVSRVVFWCTRPQRVSTAGWYVISWISLVAIWMAFNVFALPAHSSVPVEDILNSLADLSVLVAVGVVPSVWLGWKAVCGKTWALWCLLGIAVIRIPFVMKAMVSEPVYFAMIYRDNPLFSFVDHSMMLIATTIQLFLCLCGIAAVRRSGNDRSVSNLKKIRS